MSTASIVTVKHQTQIKWFFTLTAEQNGGFNDFRKMFNKQYDMQLMKK